MLPLAGDTETLLQAYAVREVVDGLAARLAAEERTSLEVGTAARAIEQHVQILAAIESGDPEEAERAARSHIRATTDRLESLR
ncbi:FCD domain-containing protein [Streptomyces sp. Inha503]|uniref:FCD domain-containing protein n=1 Tax=Streptomyces sp. Inha503 TaxID=3383314 RepID=UPI0039A30A9C